VGDVHVPIRVINPRTGARSPQITVLADTGTTLAVLPRAVLESYEARTITVVLAGGRSATRAVGDAVISVNEDSTPCRVVFGHSDDAARVGLTVLEQLGLTVDPIERRLVPRDFLL
jgi:predicted aspartyl protease